MNMQSPLLAAICEAARTRPMSISYLSLLLLAASSPDFYAKLQPETADDLRCVMVLGFAQGMKEADTDFARVPVDLDVKGERWSKSVLVEVEKQVGLSEDEMAGKVDELIQPEVERYANESETVAQRQARVDGCLTRMNSALAREKR
jgi:hypothetical protein